MSDFTDEEDFYSMAAIMSQFDEMYRAQPFTKMFPPPSEERLALLEYGGKVIMPQSALEQLSRLHILYPMMFMIGDERKTRSTHCGVLEFCAPEGIIYVPGWMMNALRIKAGSLVTILNTSLPLGKYVKIQPQSPDFLDITDPRAVLEHTLRQFTTLTLNDRIPIYYNDKVYELLVVDVRPDQAGKHAISVVETDLQVDFETPVGYEAPKAPVKSLGDTLMAATSTPPTSTGTTFTPFSGTAQSLTARSNVSSVSNGSSTSGSAAPAPLKLPPGTLVFGRHPSQTQQPPKSADDSKTKSSLFTGKSNTLR